MINSTEWSTAIFPETEDWDNDKDGDDDVLHRGPVCIRRLAIPEYILMSDKYDLKLLRLSEYSSIS